MALPGELQLDYNHNATYPMLRCPVEGCGFEYVHVTEAPVRPVMEEYSGVLGFRGDETSIPMECENGHTWRIVLAFHKGMTFLGAAPALQAVPGAPREESSGP